MPKSREAWAQIAYAYFWASMLFAKGVGLYDGQLLYMAILMSAFLALALKLVLTKYNATELLVTAGILLLAGVCYLFSDEKGILIWAAVLVGMKDVDKKWIMKLGKFVFIASFVLLLLVSLFRLYDTPYKIHDKIGLGHIFRWGLGYSHPNVLHVSFLLCLIFYFYDKQVKMSIKTFLIMFLLNGFIFLYSVSYTGVASVAIYLVLWLYLSGKKSFALWEKMLAMLVIPGCVLVSLLCPIALEGRAFDLLNKILNSRLLLSKIFLVPENISLFGKNVVSITNNSLTMDNSYVYAFVAYGIIPFTCLIVGAMALMWHSLKQGEAAEVGALIILSLAGLTEPFLFNTSFKNPGFVFAGAMLYGWSALQSKKADLPGAAVTDTWKKWLEDIEEKIAAHHLTKSVLLRAVLLGLLAMSFIFLFAKMPQQIYAPRKECADIAKDDFILISQEEYDRLSQDQTVRILGYQDETTQMKMFEGNTILMERVRNAVSTGVLTGGLFVILCIIPSRKGKKNE